MLDLSLGDPRGAHLFFLFMLFLGATLGGVVFGVVAFPWARRPRYRNFNAMPRTGALCGAGIALFIAYIAWSTAFGEFYRIEIREGVAHLHYHMPRRTPALPMEKVQGMRQSMTLDKLNPWRIQLETAEGVYFSTNMNRAQMEMIWRSLADFVRPLA